MNQKWNLQDIQPAKPRKSRGETAAQPPVRPKVIERSEREDEGTMNIAITDGNRKKNRSLWYAIGIFILVVGVAVASSALMSGAELAVTPRVKEPNVNAVFSTSRTPEPNELAYEIMTLEATGERQVSATGQETVQSQAEGTILIYNRHQSESIRLVTNTRFESPNGLIFKIKDSAVVPGYTTDDTGEIIPGVTTAEVFADAVGEQYNVTPSTFTIPGFKGDAEFDNIYAESVEDFTGGFDGKKFIIDDAELQTAQQALRMELRNSLLERIEAEMPAGFVMFDGAVSFTYVTLPSVEFGENLATIKETALMRIPLFAEPDFASFIAHATVPGYEGGEVRIEDYDVLTFAYTTSTTSASDISLIDSLEFKLTGRPLIVWEYDAGKLKADLLNANKTALPTILGAYPAIEKAEAVIRPFWKTKFPTELDKIELIEILNTAGT